MINLKANPLMPVESYEDNKEISYFKIERNIISILLQSMHTVERKTRYRNLYVNHLPVIHGNIS